MPVSGDPDLILRLRRVKKDKENPQKKKRVCIRKI